MKFPAYILTSFLCLFTLFSYSQVQKVPDSITDPIKQAQWYFKESLIKNDLLNEHAEALGYFNEGYKIAQKLQNDSLINISKYYKGYLIYLRGKDYYDEAREVFKDAIKGFVKDKNFKFSGRCYNQLGAIELNIENYNEAIKNFDFATQHLLKSDKPQLATLTTFNKAHIYMRQDKYKEALPALKKIFKFYSNKYKIEERTPEQEIKISKFKNILGICYLHLGQETEGRKLIDGAIKIFKKNDDYAGCISIYNSLREYNLKHNNYQKAVSLSDSIIKYNEKEYKTWKDKNDEYIEEHKNLENLELKLDLANKEVELKSEKNKKLTWSLILTLIIVVSLFAITFVLRKKNKTLEFLKIQAEQGERQKSKFIAMISHEMRTPLNALIGFSNLLIEESPSEHQKKHLHSIQSSADYLLNLVNNVLNLNETERGIITIENHSVTLEPFINRITDSFSLQINNKNNKLVINYDNKIPKKLKSDTLKLTQVLKNLLNNACKFTKDGNIWLNVTLFEDNSDHCMVNFEVKDTGIGISEDKYATLFEAFSNDSLDIKKSHDGTGIGLSIVQKILQAFDSEIIFDSKVGQGSSFSFALKMQKLSEEIRSEQRADVVELKGKKVLVVEDNKINQMLAMKMLKSVDALPEVCANGLLGLEAVKSKPVGYYDFVLMDIHMPVMDGYEATMLIRNLDKNLPIVALTATNLKNDKVVLDEKGFNAVIYKPYEVSHVYDVMNKFIK